MGFFVLKCFLNSEQILFENIDIDSPYEAPLNPEIHIKTDVMSVDESVQLIIDTLVNQGYLNG